MPHAKGVQFTVVPPVPLGPLLPNLPEPIQMSGEADGEDCAHFPGEAVEPSALDLLIRFLVYPPSERLKASEALEHPWFGQGVLLPEGYPLEANSRYTATIPESLAEVEGKSLGQWVHAILSRNEDI